MEKIIDRFDKYMKLKGLNDNIVTEQMSLSIGLLGKSRKEGRDLSKKMVESILNFYTDIEKVWFLTGVGDMLINADTEEKQQTIPEETNEVNEPLVELILCPECILKKKRIDSWKEKYYSLSEELNDVNRKYRELLEGKLEVKKETTLASDQKAG